MAFSQFSSSSTILQTSVYWSALYLLCWDSLLDFGNTTPPFFHSLSPLFLCLLFCSWFSSSFSWWLCIWPHLRFSPLSLFIHLLPWPLPTTASSSVIPNSAAIQFPFLSCSPEPPNDHLTPLFRCFPKAICQNPWVLLSFPPNQLSLNSSFQPSSSLGIFPNASSSFPVSSKFPNPFSFPFAKHPQMLPHPKQALMCLPLPPSGAGRDRSLEKLFFPKISFSKAQNPTLPIYHCV